MSGGGNERFRIMHIVNKVLTGVIESMLGAEDIVRVCESVRVANQGNAPRPARRGQLDPVLEQAGRTCC